MSYPNVIYGGYGDEKVTAASAIGSLPLGQLMILPDGRKFRHARAGSVTALEAGAIVSTTAEVAGHGEGVGGSGLLASATSTYNQVGDTAVVLLSKSAAVTKDQYAGGYLDVKAPAASTYIGHVYKIKSNKSCAVSSKLEIELEPGDGLRVAFKAATTLCGLRKSGYDDAIVAATSVAVPPVMGTTPVAVTKSYYFWAQRTGPASLQLGATVTTVGSAVMVSTTAGSATVAIAASVVQGGYIGRAMGTDGAASCALVDLDLE